jgi:exopolyphosphatase / guanosine-5'-triphosphate,3'-diphosphate pyrophosphatase
MRVAVVDIGTNSTRLLVADVDDNYGEREAAARPTHRTSGCRRSRLHVGEIERHTNVTRLGEGVDRSGRLLDAAIERVLSTCAEYREIIDRHGVQRTVAVLTAAVRDAANGPEFEETLRQRFGFDAETISGEREARLTYLGASSARQAEEPLLVVDIGGGSTEFVVGTGAEVDFHVSTQAGSVRHTERSLHTDPPTEDELENCRADVREEIERSVPADVRRKAADAIAVAGTPTSFAAIDQRLEPYDRDRVDGYRLSLEACERLLGELAGLPLEERCRVPGLHPDRAPTIVAGGVILSEAMRAFGLDSVEVSEHDILDGAALEAARTPPSA